MRWSPLRPPQLVYLACQSPASPPVACCIPGDPDLSRIYGHASSLSLWGLHCRYSLCPGGSGWQQKGWRGAEGWGWQNESWRGQVLGLGVGFVPPVGAVTLGISNEISCGDKRCHRREGFVLPPSCILAETSGTEHRSPRINGYLISYGRHSSSGQGGGGTALSRCARANGMRRTVLTLVPRGPGESCGSFQRRLLPLFSWSLILSGAREIFLNESFSEIGLLYGKASVSVNQQFLMKNLLSENSQEAPTLPSERLPSSEHITGIYGALPWFIVLQ